jgi:hypothetical protein
LSEYERRRISDLIALRILPGQNPGVERVGDVNVDLPASGIDSDPGGRIEFHTLHQIHAILVKVRLAQNPVRGGRHLPPGY